MSHVYSSLSVVLMIATTTTTTTINSTITTTVAFLIVSGFIILFSVIRVYLPVFIVDVHRFFPQKRYWTVFLHWGCSFVHSLVSHILYIVDHQWKNYSEKFTRNRFSMSGRHYLDEKHSSLKLIDFTHGQEKVHSCRTVIIAKESPQKGVFFKRETNIKEKNHQRSTKNSQEFLKQQKTLILFLW